MGALAAAFSCLWILVALYVGRLGARQRELALRIERLADARDSSGQRPHSQAA